MNINWINFINYNYFILDKQGRTQAEAWGNWFEVFEISKKKLLYFLKNFMYILHTLSPPPWVFKNLI